MTPEKPTEVQKHGREPISLHTPLGEDGDSKFGDLIEDSEAIQPGEAVTFTLLLLQLHSVPGTLSEREARRGVPAVRPDRQPSSPGCNQPSPPGSRTYRMPRSGRPSIVTGIEPYIRAERRIARQEQ